MKVKIAIAATGFVIAVVALALSARAWHSWNLFGRQYRFPRDNNVVPRLGGKKSGGFMAMISWDQD